MHYLSAQPCRRLAGFCAGSWKGELTLVNGWDKRGNLPSVLICVWTFFFVCGSWFAVATLINIFFYLVIAGEKQVTELKYITH